MTKNELAYKIGSQSIWGYLKPFFGMWFFITLGTLGFIGGVMIFQLANGLKNDAIPEWRKYISSREMTSGKFLSKDYSVKIIKKIETPSPFLVYKIQSSDIKSKAGSSFSYIQVPEVFEERFLQEANTNFLKLEYYAGHADHPNLVYPVISQWQQVLDELDEGTFSLYLTATRLVIQFHLGLFLDPPKFQNISQEENSEVYFDFLMWLAMPCVGITVYVSQKKRRSIFLRNFKNEDLLLAEPCVIEKIKRTQMRNKANYMTLFGSVYKIAGKDDAYVIYNGMNSKSYEGFLLKYENQYYFINKKWMPKRSPQRKTA